MHKKFAVLLLVLLGLTVFITPALASNATYDYVTTAQLVIGDPNAKVNGDNTTLDQPAYVKNGRTLVPFRFLAEALGATVSWDGVTGTAGLSLRDSEVKVTIGSNNADVNGERTVLDVPAEIKGGRTFIPLRFVSEALGAEVDYDADTKTINIVLVDESGWNKFTDSTGSELYYPSDWTVNGDSDSEDGLTVTSKTGSELFLKYLIEEPAQILESQKEEYIANGFEVIEQEQALSTDPSQEITIHFGRPSSDNPGELEIVSIFILGDEGGSLLTRISTTTSNGFEDLAIINKMVR